MTFAMVFPGQGSQSVGMQANLAAGSDVVARTFDQASTVLGYDLWRLVQDGPADRLDETVVTQPAMLTAGVSAWRAWLAAGGTRPAFMAGHSLGEYSALVAAEAISLGDALTVVERRAELMQSAVPAGAGAMAAILGLDDDAVAAACRDAAGDEICEPVNFNAPGQVVIAGHAAAVERAIGMAKQGGARRALPLPVSVPAHCALMRDAGRSLADALAEAHITEPAITVFSASDATPYRGGDDIRQRLAAQVSSPVRWVDTINAMAQAGADRIIECGPGKVLAGLVRRIDKAIETATIDSQDGLDNALAA